MVINSTDGKSFYQELAFFMGFSTASTPHITSRPKRAKTDVPGWAPEDVMRYFG